MSQESREEELAREMARQIPVYRESRAGMLRIALVCGALAGVGTWLFLWAWKGEWALAPLAALVVVVANVCSGARCLWVAVHWTTLIAKAKSLQRAAQRQADGNREDAP